MQGTYRPRAPIPRTGPLVGVAISLAVLVAAIITARQAPALEPIAVAEPHPVQLVHDVLPTDATIAPDLTTPPTAPPTTAVVPPPPASPPSTAAPAPPPVGPPPRTAMFIGDSVAYTTAVAVQPWASSMGIAIQNEGIQGCGVVAEGPYRYFGKTYAMTDRCAAWKQTWSEALARNRPDVAVVVVGRWELMDRVHKGRWQSIHEPQLAARVEAGFDEALSVLVGKTRVVLTTQPYYHRGFRPDGGDWPEDDPARVDALNQIIRKAAAKHPQVTLVDLGARMSPEGRLAMEVGGVKLRSDGVHVAAAAGPWIGPWLMPQVKDAR